MTAKNEIHRFTFEQHDVRGELVQLSDTYAALIQGHDYPAPVAKVLGQLLVVTSMLTATLKFKGHINVQLQGNGALNYATVNGSHDQSLRGVARVRGEIQDSGLLDMLGDDALLIITLTPEHGERYQGMVKVEDNDLGAIIERYFAQSEQLPTRVWTYVDLDSTRCAGLMLQVLPGTSREDRGYEHTVTLAETLTPNEAITLPAEEVLRRLYHEEDIRLYPKEDVVFRCGCSRERTAMALRNVDRSELRDIIAKEGKLSLTCDYCLATYDYDTIDIEALDGHDAPTQAQ